MTRAWQILATVAALTGVVMPSSRAAAAGSSRLPELQFDRVPLSRALADLAQMAGVSITGTVHDERSVSMTMKEATFLQVVRRLLPQGSYVIKFDARGLPSALVISAVRSRPHMPSDDFSDSHFAPGIEALRLQRELAAIPTHAAPESVSPETDDLLSSLGIPPETVAEESKIPVLMSMGLAEEDIPADAYLPMLNAPWMNPEQ